jgi:TM2 domain-containing membrane protein YozV/RNA polymerase subunit RPABC4/transcription elongation factor Spt4
MVGKTVQCPHCESTFTTAATDEVLAELDDEPAGGTSKADRKYCVECGALIKAKAVICPKCGCSQPRRDESPAEGYDPDGSPGNSNRIAAGVFAVLLGWLGIHKFILGYTGAGITMLLVSILGACVYVGPVVMFVIGLVEGILYLSKSDSEFHRVYVLNRRPWF